MRRLTWLISAAAVATALAGCGSSHHAATSPGSSTTTASGGSATTVSGGSSTTLPASGTTPTTSGSSPATTPGVVVTTVPTTPECATSQLGASLGSPDGTAGTVYYQLNFTNHSTSTACTMQGYPGVSFVAGSDGHQVGAAARRETGPAAVLTLGPGQSASATLGIVEASAYGSACQVTPVMGLRVYPPNNTAALYVPHSDQGCANPADVVLNIRPVGAAP